MEPYLIAAILGRTINSWLKNSGYQSSGDETRRIIAKRAAVHIGRIAAFLWRESDQWNVDTNELVEQLDTLLNNPEKVQAHFETAFQLLSDLIRDDDRYSADVDRALKSSALDHDVNKALHSEKFSQSN